MLTHQLLPLNGSNGKIKFLGSFIPYGMSFLVCVKTTSAFSKCSLLIKGINSVEVLIIPIYSGETVGSPPTRKQLDL